jgi:hypothetical protein
MNSTENQVMKRSNMRSTLPSENQQCASQERCPFFPAKLDVRCLSELNHVRIIILNGYSSFRSIPMSNTSYIDVTENLQIWKLG